MATILYLTQIQFEFGAIRQLAAECERIGIRRPLVVTDAGVRAAGVLQRRYRWATGTRIDVVAIDGWRVRILRNSVTSERHGRRSTRFP